MQRLYNSSVDAATYYLRLGDNLTEINIKNEVDAINRFIEAENYNDLIAALNGLKTIIGYRVRLIRDFINDNRGIAGLKVPGTNYAGATVINHYKELIQQIDALLIQATQEQTRTIERMRRLIHESVRLQQERLIEEAEQAEELQADQMIRRQQFSSVLRQMYEQQQRREYEEYLDSEYDMIEHQIDLSRTIRYIEVEVYVGSNSGTHNSTIGTPGIFLSSSNEDLMGDDRITLRERYNIPLNALNPLFNAIPMIRDRLIPLNDNTQQLLMDILGVDNWDVENSWFLIIVPDYMRLGGSTQEVPRSDLRAYTEDQLMNYPVFGSCKFPYAHFINPEPKYDENCIVNILIHKYHVEPTSKNVLSQTTIKDFFKSGTSIRNILNFFKKYKISYSIYDIVGKRLLTNPIGMKVDTKSRSAIALMLFNNHACVYDIALNKELDLTLSTDHTVKDWHSTKKIFEKSEIMDILVPGLKLSNSPPNYTPIEEKDIFIRSLTYGDPKHTGKSLGYDQNKAFYNNFMKCDPNMKIGIWSVEDEYVPYNNENIIGYAKYLLRDVKGILGQQNNVILGFRLAWWISHGRLSKSDIAFINVPTYTISCRYLQEMLRKEQNRFSIYNGILGRISTKSAFCSMSMSQEDLRFLWHYHPDLTYKPVGSEYHVNIPIKKSKHLELNNRNYYEFIVEMTNHRMEVAMMKVLDTNPGVQVTKLWVDLMAFDQAIDDRCLGPIYRGKALDFYEIPIGYPINVRDILGPSKEECEFKYEETYIKGHIPDVIYYNPPNVDFKSFRDNCIVITGQPGCGKTTNIKNDLKYDLSCSYTNVASLLVNGKTLHKTFFLHDLSQFYKSIGRFRGNTIWIDEISQIPAWIWSCIFTIYKRVGVKFILSGDKDQLRPCKENPNYEGTFFSTLFENALRLTKNYRCTPALVSLSQRVLNEEVIFTYEVEFNNRINYHFTLTKVLRDAINDRMMIEHNLTFNPPTIGLRVVAHTSIDKLGIVKGSIFNIISYTTITWNGGEYEMSMVNNKVKLQGIFPNNNTIEVSKSDYLRYFGIGYARTIDSCIGLTIDEDIAIYEIGKIQRKPYWRNRIYTAVTRVTSEDKLHIYKKYPTGMTVGQSKIEIEERDVELPIYKSLTPNFSQKDTLLTII